MTKMIVTIKDVTKTYGDIVAVKNVSLNIEKGKIIGLLGPNGSGKSTLIKMINGLLTPTSGDVLVYGNTVGVESKKVISYLPERTYLNLEYKVYETLEYFKDFYDDFDIEKARRLLDDLDINIDKPIKTLSKGMREKVQLILVMSRNADLYILDEPIGGVDPASRDYILDTILNNFNNGSSIILSTHLIADIERILDEVILIDHGNVILNGNADELRQKHNDSIDGIFRNMFKYQHKPYTRKEDNNA